MNPNVTYIDFYGTPLSTIVWEKCSWRTPHERRIIVKPISPMHVQLAIFEKHFHSRLSFLNWLVRSGGNPDDVPFQILAHYSMQQLFLNAIRETHTATAEYQALYDDLNQTQSFHATNPNDPICTWTDVVTLSKVSKILEFNRRFSNQ